LKKKTLSMAILLIVLISIMFSAIPIVKANVDIPVTKLYQNDYPQKMDTSEDTIAKWGCTLTAWTMLINQALVAQGLHQKNPDGTEGPIISYTPAELNTLLNNYRYEQAVDAQGKPVNKNDPTFDHMQTMNGWSLPIGADGKPVGSSTDINMGALLGAIEKDTKSRSFEGVGLQQKKSRTPGYGGIPKIGSGGVILDENYKYVLEELKAGRPVVVRTHNNGHSVLVKSFEQAEGQPQPPEGKGRYDIADPARKPDGTSIEWLDDNEYQNRIWGFDTTVFQKGGFHDPYEVPSPYWIDPLDLNDSIANPDQYGPQVLEPSFPYLYPEGGFGGFIIPVDKVGLLVPYIGLTSTILVATVAIAIYVKRVKRRKEKQ
jgi:hypothetical protein